MADMQTSGEKNQSCSQALCCNPFAYGIGFGNIVAAILSARHWHSVFWAIVNGFFGWVYVIYYIIKYT